MTHDLHDLDLETIAQTFRSVADVDAFDAMLAAWDARLTAGSVTQSGRLNTYLRDAVKLLKSQKSELGQDPLEVEVNQVSRPAIALSPELGVVLTNASGRSLFGVSQGRTFSIDRITEGSRSDFRALQRSARGSGNHKHSLIRVYETEGAIHLAEVFVLSTGKTQKDYLIVRSVNSAWSPSVEDVLDEAFGLTSAELQIARRLVEGQTPARIAEERGTSIQTVRTQIKVVIDKSGAQSLVDLVRLLSLTCARITERDVLPDVRWTDPWGQYQTLKRPDGFEVAYSWSGAPDGHPVFLLHGLSLGYLLGDKVERQLKEAGLKLVAPCWPGMGGSELNPALSLQDNDLVAYRAFADALELKNCLGVGLATGTIHLLALERARPGTFGSILGISDCFPLTPSRLALAPLTFRTMLRLPQFLPKALEMVVSAGFRNVRRKGIDWYVERRYQQSSMDQTSCEDVEFVPLMRNWCELTFTMGPAIFCDRAAQRWEFREEHLEDLPMPLHVLMGVGEPMFDPDYFAKLEGENARLSIEIVEGAGELLLHQRADLIAQRIIRASESLPQPDKT